VYTLRWYPGIACRSIPDFAAPIFSLPTPYADLMQFLTPSEIFADLWTRDSSLIFLSPKILWTAPFSAYKGGKTTLFVPPPRLQSPHFFKVFLCTQESFCDVMSSYHVHTGPSDLTRQDVPPFSGVALSGLMKTITGTFSVYIVCPHSALTSGLPF